MASRRQLPSGLTEGSARANAAEAAESARLDRELGLAPSRGKKAADTGERTKRALGRVGLDLRGEKR